MSSKVTTAVAVQSIVLPETASVSLPTFMNIVRKHDLSRTEVGLFVEMIELYRVSVPFVSRLLDGGTSLHHINGAYVLREKLEPLYDPNSSKGGLSSEFGVPVEKASEFLEHLFGEKECDDDECIEAAIRLLAEIADRCPQIQSWSTILEVFNDIRTPLDRAIESRVGDMLDLPPDEKVEMMLEIIDKSQLIVDNRL